MDPFPGIYLQSHDHIKSKLANKIESIVYRFNNSSATEFVPDRKLFKVLDIRTLTKELKKYDSCLKKRSSVTEILVFGFPQTPKEKWKAAHSMAKKIFGDIRQHIAPWDPSSGRWRLSAALAPSNSCLKILAILILIEKPARINLFLKEGICDSDLPFEEVLSEEYGGPLELRRKADNSVRLACFSNYIWDQSTLREFYHCQWKFLAPHFRCGDRKDIPHTVCDPRVHLPLTVDHELDKSGFARVRKVRIHPDQHNFGKTSVSFSIHTRPSCIS